MSPVHRYPRPTLDRPIAILAFEGWNDAGDAAGDAVRWWIERTAAEPIGRIDSEDFVDFTANRPEIVRSPGGFRSIRWPDTVIHAAPLDDANDLVLVLGTEPQLRWRTWSELVLDVLAELDVSMVVLLGSLLAEVPHTLPTRVTATSSDPDRLRELGLEESSYEGPTGIVGVLAEAAEEMGLPTVSLWATVPDYIGAPDPKAQLALVRRSERAVGHGFSTLSLEREVIAYERQLADLLDDDPELTAFIADLEARVAIDDAIREAEAPTGLAATDPGEFVEEVERYLRGDG